MNSDLIDAIDGELCMNCCLPTEDTDPCENCAIYARVMNTLEEALKETSRPHDEG